MRLKEIEISGFKSFAKKASMPFDAKVTSVVGPNGSGKSNVVEAFRFVLGEQSMKSMRGKSGADLIFRGGANAPKISRAAVSITFDNSDKIFVFGGENGSPILFDTITFTRELFADGTSKYSMNGTEIRLKQMVEMLASVNIGTSTHHIISQGEADGVLRASARERREMLEDALGLKVIHMRIKESISKLTKADGTLKEVASLRRELAPHLSFLKRQVEKFEKSRAIRKELEDAQVLFLSYEKLQLHTEDARLREAKDFIQRNKQDLEKCLAQIPVSGAHEDTTYSHKILEIKKAIGEIEAQRRSTESQIARLQGVIEAHRSFKAPQKAAAAISFAADEYAAYIGQIEDLLARIESAHTVQEALVVAKELRIVVATLAQKTQHEAEQEVPNYETEIHHIALDIEHFEKELSRILEKQQQLIESQKEIENHREQALLGARTQTEERYKIIGELQTAENEQKMLDMQLAHFRERKAFFDTELREAGFLFGPAFLHQIQNTSVDENTTIPSDIQRQIEKLKIRLDEHASVGSEVLSEYETAVERDNFLAKEMLDIEASVKNLELLIIDLKKTLDDTFVAGVQHINEKFGEFFKAMFGGGSAFLSVVSTKKRRAKTDESVEVESEDEEDEQNTERGIEVHVSLPEKKVKELTMLSGGERSLVSIALLFAISQVNPPPFLVLDETDAALDEANARRYGDMIERLSAYSQLIVVTHNRETMSRASVLYGVTLGADGGSKVLSIKFDEAVKVAK